MIDMTLPGITVRPIINIAGVHELNQVFFEEVPIIFERVLDSKIMDFVWERFQKLNLFRKLFSNQNLLKVELLID